MYGTYWTRDLCPWTSTCIVHESRATSAAASLADMYAAAAVPAVAVPGAEVLATGEREPKCWQRVRRDPLARSSSGVSICTFALVKSK